MTKTNYNKYLKSAHWKELKSKKIKRCAICAKTTNIDTHHLNYKELYDVDTTDLRSLCRDCHFLTHRLFKQGIIKFKSTNHHSRFAIIKAKVKKHLGITHKNMFNKII